MPPVFGPPVTVVPRLVILGGGQRQDRTVHTDHGDEAGFFAGKKFFDDDPSTGVAKGPVSQHVVDCGVSLFQRLRHDHALAGSEAIGLDDDRRTDLLEIRPGFFQVSERRVVRGRNPVPDHEFLGKGLGAFQACRLLAGAEAAQARAPEAIHDAGGQRRLGTDHGQPHVLFPGEFQQRVDVLGGHQGVAHLGLQRRARIAGRHDHFLDTL